MASYTETDLFGKLPRPVVLATARDPLKAALFNHASMALNNNLYFNGIVSKSDIHLPPGAKLRLIVV